MADIIKEANDAIKAAIGEVGAQNIYIHDVFSKLHSISDATIEKDPDEAERKVGAARREMTVYAGRTEAYAKREEANLSKKLTLLKDELPERMRRDMATHIRNAQIFERKLELASSRFTGQFKEIFDEFPKKIRQLKIAIQLLQKKPEDKKRQALVQESKRRAITALSEIIKYVQGNVTWTAGFVAELKIIQGRLAGIQAWIQS